MGGYQGEGVEKHSHDGGLGDWVHGQGYMALEVEPGGLVQD